MTAPVAWQDPCVRADALREAYFALLAGQGTAEATYSANGVSRSVSYAKTDLAALERELRAAEAECANGGVPTRRIHTVLLQTSKGV